ncbi:porimin isoform X2 [Dermochelys coriacea]|uniref:porimin isoform X2 n=1 Tax=Dermochelys coriacea TaxID=27794 RepID=UPI0018E881D6|nr:porimin isoform X2 [Dermochelys coriacea]
MRRSAGAASPLRAAALLLAAGCLAALDKNATLTTISGSTKATTIQITTTTTTTQTNTTAPNQTTTSATVSKPTTAIQSTASVTVTTSNTMSPSSSVRATPKSAAVLSRTSRFDVGSFFGGIVLTLGMLAILYVGCKTYHSRRGVQYRTIDEHDAII